MTYKIKTWSININMYNIKKTKIVSIFNKVIEYIIYKITNYILCFTVFLICGELTTGNGL